MTLCAHAGAMGCCMATNAKYSNQDGKIISLLKCDDAWSSISLLLKLSMEHGDDSFGRTSAVIFVLCSRMRCAAETAGEGSTEDSSGWRCCVGSKENFDSATSEPLPSGMDGDRDSDVGLVAR